MHIVEIRYLPLTLPAPTEERPEALRSLQLVGLAVLAQDTKRKLLPKVYEFRKDATREAERLVDSLNSKEPAVGGLQWTFLIERAAK